MAHDKPAAASNKYVRILGITSAVCLVLTVAGMIMQSTQEDAWGRSVGVTFPPLGYVGLALGVLWLVVKAVLAGRDQ